MNRLVKTWIVAVSVIGALAALVFFVDLNALRDADGARFLGRFHILILHFPIACLAVALLAEVLGRFKRFASVRAVSPFLTLVGALSAAASVLTGALLMVGEGHEGALMDRHRLLGLLVAVAAILAAAFRWTALGRGRRVLSAASTVCLAAACGLVVVAAHDGGSLVHGKDYLLAHAPAWARSWLEPQPAVLASADSEGGKVLVSAKSLAHFEDTVEPVLGRYCFRCHGEEDPEGGFRLDELSPSIKVAYDIEKWRHVRSMLASHEMPPEDARTLPEDERSLILGWIDGALNETAVARRAENGSFPMRRLTRREFENTYQDLFGVTAAFANHLPPDPVSKKGFDTAADQLMISNVDLQLYLETAREALDKYVRFGEGTEAADRYFFEAEDIYHYCRGVSYVHTMEKAPVPLSLAEFEAAKRAREEAEPVYIDRVYGPLPFGEIPAGVVRGLGGGRGFARQHEQFLLIRTERKVGEVVVRIHAAATKGADGSYPLMRLEAGRSFDLLLKTLTADDIDVRADRENPGMYEYRFRLEDALPPLANEGAEGPMPYLLLVISNVARHESGALGGSVYGHADIFTDGGLEPHPGIISDAEEGIESGRKTKAKWRDGKTNLLHLDAIEVEIVPPAADPNNPWVVRMPESVADEEPTVRDTLGRFARTAFRRSVDAEELDRYVSLYQNLRAEGIGFQRALKDAMSSVLVSRPFLYVGRSKLGEEVERRQDLASRLSYFIWSSMPDERLIDLASNGALSDPKVLSEEVRRMVDSPKAERFTHDFARQWLGLDKLKDVVVSDELYPDFDDELAQLLKMQTIKTFDDVFDSDRDARDLFRSNAMILNDQLARHYGYGQLLGGELRRVEVGDRVKNWGGVLSHGSVLAINSDGNDSHPIKRGVWLLDKILDDPPPPPPPVVPEIDNSDPDFAKLSLKEKIERHREVHSCSGCHGKIDPWGIAFEEFDAVGRWRDTANATRAIDASTVLPDGEEISGFQQLCRYLLEDREDQMMLSLVKHMMVYALGRDLDVLDDREANEILRSFRISGYSIKHLVLAIAQSDAFTQSPTPKDTHG